MAAFWDRQEKPYIMFLFFMPSLWMVCSLFMGRYFPDPGKALISLSGIWAGVFIVATLSMTPFVKYTSFKVISRYRRFIGLAAFFYSVFHLVVYLVLFTGLNLTWITSDLIEKPYIYAGVLAIFTLGVLAITSTKKMMRRMGRKWKIVHKFIYLAAACVLVHQWLQIKGDVSVTLWFSVFIGPLLALRVKQIYIIKKHFKKT